MSHTFFVYGTLMEPERQKVLFGRLCQMTKATLTGYKRLFGKWPYIIEAAHEAVVGAIIANLSDAELAKLDIYEDVPGTTERPLYKRQRLDVDAEKGHTVSCWVYVPLLENWDATWLEGSI